MFKSKTGKRFLLTYLSLIICLVLLFVPLYHLVVSLFRNSYLNTCFHLLENGTQRIENDITSINTIVKGIYENPDIKRIAYLKQPIIEVTDYYKIRVAIDDFKNSISQINSIRDCGLIFSNDLILTPRRLCYSGDELFSRYFSVNNNHDYISWRNSLLDNKNISNICSLEAITSYENGIYQAITLVIKMPLSSLNYHGLFYATIDKNYLLSYFATQEMLDYGTLYIRDKNGNLLLAHEKMSDNNLTYENFDNNLTYINKESEKLGLIVSIGISNNFFTQKIKPLKDIAILFFIIYILSGVILSLIFSYRTSKPVLDIINRVTALRSKYFYNLKSDRTSSEYKYLLDFLNEADFSFQKYEQILKQQEDLLCSNMLEQLIRGQIYSSSAFTRAYSYFPNFPKQYCIAAILLYDSDKLELSSNAIRQTLIFSIVKPKLPSQALIHFTSNLLVLVLPFEQSNSSKEEFNCSREGIAKLLIDIKDLLFKKSGIYTQITISDIFSKIEDMHLAFYQASHLLRLIGKTPTDKIYYTDDFSLSYSHPELDFWEINRFYECILRAEEEQALNIVLSIQKNIKELGYIDESEIQQIFYSFRQVFVRIKNELPQQYSSLIPIPTYDDTTDIFALFKHIIKCTCACCDCIKIQ
ncbi:MAG: hypothetical protein GYA02_05060 [Clostridiaceae bacterium]|nr:hypothetical protein [Clostridiaceae bacterium]